MQNTTTTKTTRYPMSNVFVTGVTIIQNGNYPWFIENFQKFNTTQLVIADFGMMNYPDGDFTYVDMSQNKAEGWFKKPSSLIKVAELGFNKVCWLDTDCQVLEDISSIFNYAEPDKLGMIEDRPWIKEDQKWVHGIIVVLS